MNDSYEKKKILKNKSYHILTDLFKSWTAIQLESCLQPIII